jgi:hypothetical protein
MCAYLAFLAGRAEGQAKIKRRVIADPADATLAIVYLTRGGVTSAIFVTYELSDIGGTRGPSGSVWALIVIKAMAFFRNQVMNTYHDEDYGTVGEMAVDFGDQIIESPGNTAQARAMNAAGNGVFFSTPDDPERDDTVADHVYYLPPESQQPANTTQAVGGNVWGANSGSKGLRITVGDLDFALHGFGWQATSPPQNDVLALPASVQAKLAAANSTASATDGPPPLSPAVPDAPASSITINYQCSTPGFKNGSENPRSTISWTVTGAKSVVFSAAHVEPSPRGVSDSVDVEQWQGPFLITALGTDGSTQTAAPDPWADVQPVSPVTPPALTLESLDARVKVLEAKLGVV